MSICCCQIKRPKQIKDIRGVEVGTAKHVFHNFSISGKGRIEISPNDHHITCSNVLNGSTKTVKKSLKDAGICFRDSRGGRMCSEEVDSVELKLDYN
jgi:hypothetical protein